MLTHDDRGLTPLVSDLTGSPKPAQLSSDLGLICSMGGKYVPVDRLFGMVLFKKFSDRILLCSLGWL